MMILMIGVVISSFLLFWSLSLTSGSGEGFDTGIFANNAKLEEQISIDNINFDTKTIYVRNYGDNPVKIRAIYIDGAKEDIDETITARNAVAINIANLPINRTITVRVATERGTQFEEMFKAP